MTPPAPHFFNPFPSQALHSWNPVPLQVGQGSTPLPEQEGQTILPLPEHVGQVIFPVPLHEQGILPEPPHMGHASVGMLKLLGRRCVAFTAAANSSMFEDSASGDTEGEGGGFVGLCSE